MAAVGPITAKPLQDRGIEPLVPERGRLGALVRTLVGHYGGLQALQTIAGPLQVHRGTAVLDGHVLRTDPDGPGGPPAARRRRRGRGAAGPGAGRAARATRRTRTPPRWPSRGSGRRPEAAS